MFLWLDWAGAGWVGLETAGMRSVSGTARDIGGRLLDGVNSRLYDATAMRDEVIDSISAHVPRATDVRVEFLPSGECTRGRSSGSS